MSLYFLRDLKAAIMQDEPVFLPWYVTIEPTSCAIQHLLPSAVTSLASIAPERLSLLLAKSDDLALTISDSDKFRCEALPSFKAIVISRRAVELAWAFSYAYWEIYQVVYAGKQLDGGTVDLQSFPSLAPALRLLRWAQRGLGGSHEDPWPTDAPRPTPTRAANSPEHVADELALCSIAMYLHHELAHVYAPQTPPLSALEEERFCDSSAADWILGDASLSPAVIQKRGLGVAIGMLMLTVRGLGHGNTPDGVHPPSYERLVAVLHERVPKEQEAVWGMVVGMLALHIGDAGLPNHTIAYDEFRDAALGYCDHIHTHTAALQSAA